jgi:hypothetical protein
MLHYIATAAFVDAKIIFISEVGTVLVMISRTHNNLRTLVDETFFFFFLFPRTTLGHLERGH